MQWFFAIAVSCTIALTHGLQSYQSRLPNGYRIPHPCFTNTIWKGVGHKYHGGGGALNPFGEDFRANQFKWDKCLCEMDSDQDGVKNGIEMGDPNCVWTEGSLPEEAEVLSHPGVCEPMNSTFCESLNTWEICEEVEFDCPAIHGDGVVVQEKRFNKVEIAASETVYMCMAVHFDESKDVHAIAMTPIVDNELIVHHIEMYECVTEAEIDSVRPYENNASHCGGGMSADCRNMLAAWSLGISGICLVDQAGLRLGKNGAKWAKLIIHYHNPNRLQGEMDTSGMTFYTVENRRSSDIGVFNFGQYYVEIPPGQNYYEQVLTCGPFCTNTFAEDIYFIFGAIHMHYLGIGGYAELYRNGTKVQDIMRQDHYDYLAPHIENFPNPVRIQPGDTIRYVCQFQSRDRTDVTWWGGGAFDEMCNVYFAYYPQQNLTECDNYGKIMKCDYNNLVKTDVDEDWEEKGCDVDDFDYVYDNYMQSALKNACDNQGSECSSECNQTLDWAYNNHTCLSGDARTGMFRRKWDLRSYQSTCASYPVPDPPMLTTTPGVLDCDSRGGDTGAAATVIADLVTLTTIITAIILH